MRLSAYNSTETKVQTPTLKRKEFVKRKQILQIDRGGPSATVSVFTI